MRLVGRTIPALVLCLAVSALLAGRSGAVSAPGLEWEVILDSYPESGGHAYDVLQDVVATEDGGALAGGYSIPPGSWTSANQSPLLVRLDAFGAERWRTYLGGPLEAGGFEVRQVRAAADGGFMVACAAWTPFQSGSEGLYYNTSFVAKVAAGGRTEWNYRFDPRVLDEIGGIDVLSDGSVLATGRVWTYGGGTATTLAKLSPFGQVIWIRTDSPVHVYRVSGATEAADGGFFVATQDSSNNPSLTRYTQDGSPLWSRVVSGLDGEDYWTDKCVFGLAATPDGGCVVTGGARIAYTSTYGAFQPFLARFDGRGRQTETLVVPTASSWLHAAQRLSDGGLLAAEAEGSDAGTVFVRYDRLGRELWREAYTATSEGTSVHAIRETRQGGIVAAGAIRETGFQWGPSDGYVLKLAGGGSSNPAVRIDVLPGSKENPVNCRSRGLLPVALLSSPTFDASKVSAAAVTLDGVPVARVNERKLHAVVKDVDRDGLPDLLLSFPIPALGLTPATQKVTLDAVAPDGTTFSASDVIRAVGPREKFKTQQPTKAKGHQ